MLITHYILFLKTSRYCINIIVSSQKDIVFIDYFGEHIGALRFSKERVKARASRLGVFPCSPSVRITQTTPLDPQGSLFFYLSQIKRQLIDNKLLRSQRREARRGWCFPRDEECRSADFIENETFSASFIVIEIAMIASVALMRRWRRTSVLFIVNRGGSNRRWEGYPTPNWEMRYGAQRREGMLVGKRGGNNFWWCRAGRSVGHAHTGI